MARDSGISDIGFVIGNAADALDALIRQSGDCIKVIDLDGRIIKWNTGCEETYGWRAGEVIGHVLPQVPDEMRLKWIRHIRTVCDGGMVTERDIEAQRADGTRLNMRVVLIPLTDADGDSAGVMTVAREMLVDSRLERQREQFMGIIARDLTEPFATIANAASLLMRREVMADATRRDRLIRTIAERTRGVSEFVEDVQLTSQLVKGQLVLDREVADLTRVVGTLVSDFGDKAGRIAVDFQVPMQPVLIDVARIRRSVAILILRAFKQAPENGVVLVSVFERGHDAVVEVRDQGQDARATEAQRVIDQEYPLTEPYGADDVDTRLTLVRGIAEAHGGRFAMAAGNHAACAIVLPLAIKGA